MPTCTAREPRDTRTVRSGMGSCISWLAGCAAASRRPPNRDGSGARVPIGWQPRSPPFLCSSC